MKGIVADLIGGAHGENRLPRRVERAAANFAVRGSRRYLGIITRLFMAQMDHELLPDRVGHQRFVSLKAGEPGSQRAFTRRPQLAADGIVIAEIQNAQERLEGQPLNEERPEDHRKRRQHDQLPVREG